MELKINIDDKLVKFIKKIISWKNVVFVIAVLFFLWGLSVFSEELIKPHTLKEGDLISASELNENFDTLYNRELESLSNVEGDGKTAGKIIKWNGAKWIMADDTGGGNGSYWDLNGNNISYNLGNVGINTNTPEEKLEINGNLLFSQTSTIESNGSLTIQAYSDDSGLQPAFIRLVQADDVIISPGTNPGEDYNVILAHTGVYPRGNVGIGRLSPEYPLHMAGGAYCTGTAWVDGSSREYKENIKDLETEEAVKVINELNPVKFNYKTEKNEECLGFIAEDVPELVAMNGRNGLASMDIVAVLVKVVQEQQKKIEDLEEKLNTLEQGQLSMED